MGDSFICYEDSFYVEAHIINSGTPPYTYEWTDSSLIDEPNSISSNGFTLSTQNISLKLTDASNCSHLTYMTMEVNPPLTIIAGPDTFICYGDSAYIYSLVSDSGAGNMSYLWNPAVDVLDPYASQSFAVPSAYSLHCL